MALPRRICAEPNCRKLTAAGKTRCPDCEPSHARLITTRRSKHPRNRIYATARWKKASRMCKIRDDYTCQHCGYIDTTGRRLVADHANHGGVMAADDPYDLDNLQTLCQWCSGRKDGARSPSTTTTSDGRHNR